MPRKRPVNKALNARLFDAIETTLDLATRRLPEDPVRRSRQLRQLVCAATEVLVLAVALDAKCRSVRR